MTLHTVTTYTVTCDGTLATACDATHLGRPHQCPETLTTAAITIGLSGAGTLTTMQTLTAARWTIRIPDGDPAQAQHYCPTHRHQAWPEGCRCTLDPDGTRITHDCPHHRDPG
jgi:hypothetical protein